MVRPGLDFGEERRDEDSKHCWKNYKKWEMRLSGIFTVQCVCRFPKVVRISVIFAMEGVSIALS